MGLPTFARQKLKEDYKGAFTYSFPPDVPKPPTICVYDLMKDIKWMPEDIVSVEEAITYLTKKISSILHEAGTTIQKVIVLLDRAPHPVKRMIAHTRRHRNIDRLSTKGGPYLSTTIPRPWIGFASNQKLMRREFYPRLFNAFMDGVHVVPRPGQMVILHGFPGYSEWAYVVPTMPYANNSNRRGEVEQVHLWNVAHELPITPKMEKEDPDLYNRIYFIECVPSCPQWPEGYIRRTEWKEAKNDISEADSAMFFYDHWFQNETFLLICNDGDIFSYGLMYSCERVLNRNNDFRNHHVGRLPFSPTKAEKIMFPTKDKEPPFDYIDFNRFFILVKDDLRMGLAGVQNHIVTLVFLLIMAESDFFKDFMKGIGSEKIIWETFFACLDQFSHMVQSTQVVIGDTRTPRAIVIDEDMFRIFVHYCYLQKYGASLRKKKKKTDITYDDLRAFCAESKKASTDPEYHLPVRNKIRLWCRQIEWNLLYYRNSVFGTEHSPNPFEMWMGLPYFPYIKNPQTGKPEMTDVVAAHSKPIDEVYSQYFYRNNNAKRKREPEEPQKKKKKKQAIIQQFG